MLPVALPRTGRRFTRNRFAKPLAPPSMRGTSVTFGCLKILHSIEWLLYPLPRGGLAPAAVSGVGAEEGTSFRGGFEASSAHESVESATDPSRLARGRPQPQADARCAALGPSRSTGVLCHQSSSTVGGLTRRSPRNHAGSRRASGVQSYQSGHDTPTRPGLGSSRQGYERREPACSDLKYGLYKGVDAIRQLRAAP